MLTTATVIHLAVGLALCGMLIDVFIDECENPITCVMVLIACLTAWEAFIIIVGAAAVLDSLKEEHL